MKSFSIEAKNGLCSAEIKKRCCKVSFLYGYLYAGADFRDREITFSFESDMIRKYVCKNFFDVFSIELESDRVITIDDGYTIGLLMETFLSDNDDGISDVIYTCENCSRYFMKGLFLSCGHLTDPNKSYQLEFTGLEEHGASELFRFLDWQGIPAGRYSRKGKTILYYKSIEKIEAFLSYIFASKAVFELINAKMIGEERNEINRLTNFENANLNRTISAASAQIDAVKLLIKTNQMKRLPKELQYTAQVRLAHPDASLARLAALHDPPITKSGLTHRLQKLVEYSNSCHTK